MFALRAQLDTKNFRCQAMPKMQISGLGQGKARAIKENY